MESSSYSPAPKKSKVGLILLVISVCFVFCCLAPGLFLYRGAMQVFSSAKGFVVCGAEMTAERDALLAYAKEHNNKLPAAAKWQDDIRSFMKPLVVDKSLGELPPSDGDVCDLQSSTGVCYNSDVAGKDVSKLSYDQVVLWEVPARGSNRSEKYSEPSYASSPKLVGPAPRGWIVQPLAGPSYLISENGGKSPLPDSSGLKGKHGG